MASRNNLSNLLLNLGVGTKVAIGSGIILVCLIVVAGFSYMGLSGANINFKQYRSYALQTNQMGRIQANLLTARLNAKDFILKNTDEAARKVSSRIGTTAKLINESQSLFTRPEAITTMKVAKTQIKSYQSSFTQVTELVKQRNSIVDQLNMLGPQAERNLTKIMKSAYADNDASASFLAGTALRNLLLARLYSNRFLVDNAQASADRANKELTDFEANTNKMLSELQNTVRRELAGKVLKDAKQYQVTFNNVVGVISDRNLIIKDTLDVIGPKLAGQVEELKLDNKALQDELGPRATSDIDQAVLTTKIVSILGIILGAALALLVGRIISKPIVNMTNSMRSLADGDLNVEIPAIGQKDEIGKMADTLLVFKDAAIEKVELEKRAEEERNLSEEERATREHQKEQEQQKIQKAVNELGRNLKRLADGDLTLVIQEEFTPELDGLRVDFNESVAKIKATMSSISNDAVSMDGNSQELRSAADDLSRRTEQQAASLEETSSALEEITATVKETSVQAKEAAEMATLAKNDTDKSSVVVGDAVNAMEGIEKATSKITNIINVIDEIAFQTNLLALNAGVEAARAGDAGRGFAVVAQEVRELAQRAANAAKQIKGLISDANTEVANGVDLVKAAGVSLNEISQHATGINEKIGAISTAAAEQLAGVLEVNNAVSQMDQVTQQNASMVEESTAVTHRMSDNVSSLNQMLSEFKLGDKLSQFNVDRTKKAETSSKVRSIQTKNVTPISANPKTIPTMTNGNTAVAAEVWKDF